MSIKWRISLLIAFMLMGVIPAVIAEAYSEVKGLLFRVMDRSLSASAAAAAVVLNEDEPIEVQGAALGAIIGSPQSRRHAFCRAWKPGSADSFYAEGLASGQADELAQRLKTLTPPGPGQNVYFEMGPPGEPFRAVWTLVDTHNGKAYLVLAQSTRHLQAELRELLRTYLSVGAGVVLAAAILGMMVVVWGLRPIGRTAAKLSEVTALNVGSLTLNGRQTPSELLPFVESVRTMLGRLEEAMAQQKAFISDASHELRTPVTLAKSTLQLALSKDRPAPEYRAALAAALEDLRRMEHLAEELLALARAEDMSPAPAPTEVDLAAMLGELDEMYSPVAAQAGGSLTCQLQGASVRGDEGQLRRLFGNLIENAIQHGPRGGKVAVRLADDVPGWVSVAVCDEGGNISAAALPHLFDRFYRADPSRSHTTGGAGLGLAIARQIALRHGGQIAITSGPAAGTRVTVRLPRAG